MREIIRQIACAVCRVMGGEQPPTLEKYDEWVRAQVGEIPRQKMKWCELVAMLKAHNVEPMLSYPPDYNIHFTNEETLDKIVPFLTYPADFYIRELEIDCDDYARWAAADARRIFHIQGVYEVWGNTPLGYHAWSLGIIAPDSFKMFEPNAGFEFAGVLFEAGDNKYLPEKWK